MALDLVGVMLECFAASTGGRKVTSNLCGQTGIAWALTLLHAQEWKHLRSDRRGGWAVECPVCICLSLCLSPSPLKSPGGVPEPGVSRAGCHEQPAAR